MRIRKRIFRQALVPVIILAAALMATTGAFAATGDVYDDSLEWNNWSWGSTINPSSTWPVQDGSRSMAVKYHRAWAGASFHAGGSVDTSSNTALKFGLHPNGKSLPKVSIAVYDGSGRRTGNVGVGSYASRGSNGWYNVSIPVSKLNPRDGRISRVTVQEAAGWAQHKFYIDNMRFSGSSETTVTSSTRTVTRVSTTVSRPTGSFKPSQAPGWIDSIIRDQVAKYNLPRWFYYAMIQRESGFNPNAVGSGYDLGLTQLGSNNYYGERYPKNLSSPNNNHRQYGWDMNFDKYGMWIKMDQVTPLSNPFDAKQNLDRFSTGYAVPAFNVFKKYYGESDASTLRRVAFHWNKGLYKSFDRNNWDYLGTYDRLVGDYKWRVEAQDGKWNGSPRIP